MKSVIISAAIAACVLASGSALAADSKELTLAKSKNCLACHVLSGAKTVGPAYSDVAKKYAADKGAEAKLIEKVKKGGSGVWGPMPMPANSPTVSDADIKTLVKWVLAGAK